MDLESNIMDQESKKMDKEAIIIMGNGTKIMDPETITMESALQN